MFDSQSIIVITAPKAKAINKMTCYFYPCGLLLVNNIIMDRIIFYLTLYNPPTLVVTNIDLPTTYNVLHDTT